MRILLVVPMAPQAEGAGAIPELLTAELLGLRERHEVTLVGTFGDLAGQAEAAAELRSSGIDAHFADRRPSPSPARRWRVRAELAASWAARGWPWRAVCSAPELQPILDRLGRERRFDVVAVEDSPMSVLRFPTGVPTVLTEHEAFKAPLEGWRGKRVAERPAQALRVLDGRRWDRFQRSAWSRFDLVQVFSGSDAAAIRERSPEMAPRLRINPFGMVLPALAEPAREVPGTLLFVGTFTHRPNRDAALWLAREIMPAILARHPGARLRIVGTVPPPEVLALAGPRVEVIANAPSVRPHLEAAAVVLAPVRSGGGMRMKVLQALAAGKAVVTTSRGAEGFDTLSPDLPFAVADDGEAIAAAAANLLADPRRRRELGLAARRFAELHHSPGAWAERLETIYAEAGRIAGGRS